MSEIIRDIDLARQFAYAEQEIRDGEPRLEVAPELSQEILKDLSKLLHGDWLAGIRRQLEESGQDVRKPRMRTSKDETLDEAWFRAYEEQGEVFEEDHEGKRLVNTNVEYIELPPSWQMANIKAARFVTEGVVSAVEMYVDIESDDFIEAMASEVHEQWMEDNQWLEQESPHLFVDYQKLPEDEKAKDRSQVLLAVEKIRKAKERDADARLAAISSILGRMGSGYRF